MCCAAGKSTLVLYLLILSTDNTLCVAFRYYFKLNTDGKGKIGQISVR